MHADPVQSGRSWLNRPLPAGVAGVVCAVLLLAACDGQPWNRPYPAADAASNILYSSFQERPNHLDPAQSYSSNEVTFTGQIYEPPLQYHYLKRPYELIPLTVTAVPVAHYRDADGKPLADDAPVEAIAFSDYDIEIRSGIYYQPHPAFARDGTGGQLYDHLSNEQLDEIHSLADFTQTGTRELEAADYVYQIKRLAHPETALADLRPDERLHRRPRRLCKDAGECLGGTGGHAGRRGLARPDAVPAGRRQGAGPLSLPDHHQGQVPATAVLAGDAVFRARAAGGRCLLLTARPFGAQHHTRLVPGRHRPLHAHGQQPEPADGDGKQSELSRRDLSRRRRARRSRGRHAG